MADPSASLVSEDPDYEKRGSLISEIIEKVGEVLGEAYVRADPEILSTYSRDFSITPRRRPRIQ